MENVDNPQNRGTRVGDINSKIEAEKESTYDGVENSIIELFAIDNG